MQGASEESQMLWEYLQLFGWVADTGTVWHPVETGSLLHRWVVLCGIQHARGGKEDRHYDKDTPEALIWVLNPTQEVYEKCCQRRGYYLFNAIANLRGEAMSSVCSLAGSVNVARCSLDTTDAVYAERQRAEQHCLAQCFLLASMAPWLPEPIDPGIPEQET